MRRSSEISALRIREKKAWRVIDQHLSDQCKNVKVKQAAAEFVLKRLYPEKTILAGTGEHGEFKLQIEIIDENIAPQVPGNRIQEYLTV